MILCNREQKKRVKGLEHNWRQKDQSNYWGIFRALKGFIMKIWKKKIYN